ncbi:uncharacterized protein LOC132788712 [Drosophila nasuta]|uniref:uncharacterized protein LOC132788712 n=1 Tax=Drosophila nasuta TaxID=42062 RepID=UPI00295EEA7D|nr:uncharacterized protein LOC132788712 [Drosophila nasuta]
MNDIELIKLIENYPILYDKDSARSVKNAANKDAAWKTISQQLGASERACITRWKSIRDRFGKEFRRFQEHPEHPTYWDMFPHLLFLKNHYKHGQVKHESLDNMKFEPRHRKPRRPRLETEQERKQKEEECEEDPEDIELCQQLIELVKVHPVLYDRHKIRNSKNLSAKNDAWRAISEQLNESEKLCYNRWKKLRDRFAREYRNHQINQSTPISWRYFNELLFLGRHFRKGVPLIIENIKKRGRPPKYAQCQQQQRPPNTVTGLQIEAGEQIWGADYPYSTDNDPEEDELAYEDPDDIEVVSEPEEGVAFVQMELPMDQEQHLPHQYIEEVPAESLEPQQQLHVTTTTMPAIVASVDNIPLNNKEQLTTADSSASAFIESVVDEDEEEEDAAPTAEKLIGAVISNMETVLQQSKDCLQVIQQAASTSTQSNNSLLSKVQMLLDGLSAEQRRQAERKIVHFLCECQIKTLDGQEIEDVAPCHIFN